MFHSIYPIIMVPILAVLYYLNSPIQAYAFTFTPEVCAQYNLGKNWYCETAPEKENIISANDILNSSLSPQEKAIKLNELWEFQRKTAVISERREDDERFLETQFIISKKGVDFAKRIQKITDSNPKFSSTQSYYKSISDKAIYDAEKQEILASANKRYGLVFIYSSSCQYCLRQYPIIHSFTKAYNFKVLGVSADGEYFAGLDQNITDLAIAQDPNVQAFPTIFLLDRETPEKIFISRGLITLDELEEKIVNRIKEREVEYAQGN